VQLNRFTLMVMRSDKRGNNVYLCLGSNVGDRLLYLDEAGKQLQLIATEPIEFSEVYESQPWGNELLNHFLNCVVHVKTGLAPIQLLKKVQEIELGMGRLEKSRGGQYQNRVIDIDILTYNNATIDSLCLTIPHPLLTNRKFVLLPFVDLAPEFCLPYSLKSIKNDLQECQDELECALFVQK